MVAPFFRFHKLWSMAFVLIVKRWLDSDLVIAHHFRVGLFFAKPL